MCLMMRGQIIFVPFNDRHGGSRLKMQNDYNYEDFNLYSASELMKIDVKL